MIHDDAKALMAAVNKKMGEGSVVIASEMQVPSYFTTGSLTLDVALGGGWPGNQWSEIYGQESHGKTALALRTIAANQERDKNFTALWIAAEHYDRGQSEAIGVDNDRVIVVPTQDMEFAYQTALDFAASKTIDMIIIDSYPALVPSEEAEKDMDEFSMATGARLTGKFFRKAGSAMRRAMDGSERPIAGIFINQQRDKIGGFSPHGVPQTTPGGNAKNYAFYSRVQVKRDEYIEVKRSGEEQGKVKVGQVIKFQTVKNKSAAPQQVARTDFYFRDAPEVGFHRGEFDTVKEVIVMGIVFGIIKRSGAWFTYDGNRWQGKPAMYQAIKSEPDLYDQLHAEVMNKVKHPESVNDVTEDMIEDAVNAGQQKLSRRKNVDEEVNE